MRRRDHVGPATRAGGHPAEAVMNPRGDAREAVRQALDDRRALSEIGAGLLNGAPDDEAAALWPYAWSYAQPRPHGKPPATAPAPVKEQGRQTSTPRRG